MYFDPHQQTSRRLGIRNNAKRREVKRNMERCIFRSDCGDHSSCHLFAINYSAAERGRYPLLLKSFSRPQRATRIEGRTGARSSAVSTRPAESPVQSTENCLTPSTTTARKSDTCDFPRLDLGLQKRITEGPWLRAYLQRHVEGVELDTAQPRLAEDCARRRPRPPPSPPPMVSSPLHTLLISPGPKTTR